MDEKGLRNTLEGLIEDDFVNQKGERIELSRRGRIRAEHLIAQQPSAQFYLLNHLIKERLNGDEDYNDLLEHLFDLAESFCECFSVNIIRTLIDENKSVAGFDPSVLPEKVVGVYDPD